MAQLAGPRVVSRSGVTRATFMAAWTAIIAFCAAAWLLAILLLF